MRSKIFTREEERMFLEHAYQPLRDVFVLLINTGMRPRELLSLRWENVDLSRKLISIDTGKTSASKRFIGLTMEAEATLERCRHEVGEKAVWVFPSKRKPGKHIPSASHAFITTRGQG